MTNQSHFLINYRRRPVPVGRSLEDTFIEARQHDLSLLKTAQRDLQDLGVTVLADNDTTDIEGGIEDLLRTHAAVKHFPEDRSWIHDVITDQYHSLDHLDRKPAPEVLAHAIQYGPGKDSIMHNHAHIALPDNCDPADRYWEYHTIRQAMGRPVYTAGFHPDDQDARTVDEAIKLVDAHTDPQQRDPRLPKTTRVAFAKPVAAKSMAATLVTHDQTQDTHGLAGLEFNHLSWKWAPIHLEGRADTVVIQPAIEMFHEYRIFVVNGRIVSGAGFIEQYTPFENPTLTLHPRDPAVQAFDPRTVEDRRPETPILRQEALVAAHHEFAQAVADELLTEDATVHTYVMDVALNNKGEHIVVELNPLETSSFFASHPYVIAQAFVDTTVPQ